jgi:Lrp/AsnC family transcriptional regulator, regulator of ectoine-degradation genes
MSRAPRRRRSLDRYDLALLDALARDGRLSKVELGARVGLSPTRCHERMRRLEREGLIRGYHAEIDLARLAGGSCFFIQIRLLEAKPAAVKQFERMLRDRPDVLVAHAVLGSIDYLVLVLAASVADYQARVESLIEESPAPCDYVTYPVSKVVKGARAPALGALLAALAATAPGGG